MVTFKFAACAFATGSVRSKSGLLPGFYYDSYSMPCHQCFMVTVNVVRHTATEVTG